MSRRILSRRRRLCGVCCDRERVPPGRLFFLLPTKERTKENCRCFDAADPRLGGCTPPRPPIRKSQRARATRTQYYCSRLRPRPLLRFKIREFPRTPAGGRQRPPCQRGLSPLGDWGIPTGLVSPSIPGQPPPTAKGVGCRPPLPLSSATHLRHPVGAGHARPAALPLPPMYLLLRREGS